MVSEPLQFFEAEPSFFSNIKVNWKCKFCLLRGW